MAIAFIVLITVANLRGAKEAGKLFAIPTYGFVVVVGVTLGRGACACLSRRARRPRPRDLPLEPCPGLTLSRAAGVLLGATALTGVEAIADGVQAFRRPNPRTPPRRCC